jgi:ABC-type Fe3+/spermidine/putrescine transport system ATPase subunit
LEDRQGPQLSGGQQQRVALARALVHEPSMLLLDEPFSNLDAKLREQTRVQLKILLTRLGITAVFVTHDQVEALSLSDRIAVLNAGHVEQLGTPLEMYEQPATPFVRDFLGSTVLLRGTVGAGAAADVLVHLDSVPGGMLCARRSAEAGLTPGSRVVAAIRPEDIHLTTTNCRRCPSRSAGSCCSTRSTAWSTRPSPPCRSSGGGRSTSTPSGASSGPTWRAAVSPSRSCF